MFQHPRTVARWSVIGALLNTAACARSFFIHEYAVGTWLGLLALAMLGQFWVAGKDAEEKHDD